MPARISADLDEQLAARAREIAVLEHRSVENVIAGAVAVFTAFPKELRDALLALRTIDGGIHFQALTREMAALAARSGFDAATLALCKESKLPVDMQNASDLDLCEAGTRIVREALKPAS